jgi:8-oxo-dGTP pyrophosphatase MutT (NUDIX family)
MTKFFIKYVDETTISPKQESISSVFLLAIQGSKILAIKNDRGWETPGGHVEQGETTEEALTREVKEEAGAIFSNAKILAIIESDDQEKYKDKMMLVYTTSDFTLQEFIPSEDAFERETIEVVDFLKRHKGVINFIELISRAQDLVL